ncbi:polygalacturonase At1g48100 [Amborella trichopoda]|uniref:polygalacturonase At1g48100 n=1 Tax=Amborella trichopoda TaxID=13333 RepID=UPI0009BEF2C5|nr:polygalacturonase At1g48100 [Amborella trichopoda]|eukprot:XP_020520413.1 polygalacturonase At1g48100 [Amborella trichopoda]
MSLLRFTLFSARIYHFILNFFIFLLLLRLVDPRNVHIWELKSHSHYNHRVHNDGNHVSRPNPSINADYGLYNPYNITILDVLSFGAMGDGTSDDSKAFLATWAAACKVESAIFEVPSEFRFLIGPLTFRGPCEPGLVLKIDGTIVAPSNLDDWPESGLFTWINFKFLQNFKVTGTGSIDGQGSAWWDVPLFQSNQSVGNSTNNPKMKPTAVRFYESFNLSIGDITIENSPSIHLKFDNCGGVLVTNLTVSSPGNSPNTDGIHLQNSQDVEVEYSSIACGDDCISIQTGCSNVCIHDVQCGPGHGISIGALGKDNSLACVSNITVQNITLQDTAYGARIKTWQGGLGSVESVFFSDIQVTNVKVPITIDQFYCDKRVCHNQTDAVSVANVGFNRISGTFTSQAIHLACSDSTPCIDISIGEVNLAPSAGVRKIKPTLCWNSYGEMQAPVFPTSIDCLETSNPFKMINKLNSTQFTC